MGPIRTPGGPPNPRGRVPHQRRSRALVTPPPPVGPCSPAFFPRGPGPLPCPLAPALSRLPLLAVSAPACWCPWLLALCLCFFFFFFFSALALSAGWRRCWRRGGGGFSLSSLLRKGGGGLPCGPRRHPTLPAVAPPAVPPWGLARRVPPLGTVVSPLCHSTPPRCPRGGVRRSLPSSLLSPRHLPVALASVLGGCGRWGRGGGGAPSLPFLRRKHVAGTALARGTALVLLLGCEARRVALAFALSTLRALPRCPPRW